MTRWQTRTCVPATSLSLATLTVERIHKQVLRAFRYSYGSEAALRTAVRAGATEMLAAGGTPDAVRKAIADCVDSHPHIVADKSSLVTGESRTSIVTRRMLAWVDEFLDAGTLTPS